MTLDTVVERVRLLVAPIVADLGLEIYDLELASGVLRLSVDTLLVSRRVSLSTTLRS